VAGPEAATPTDTRTGGYGGSIPLDAPAAGGDAGTASAGTDATLESPSAATDAAGTADAGATDAGAASGGDAAGASTADAGTTAPDTGAATGGGEAGAALGAPAPDAGAGAAGGTAAGAAPPAGGGATGAAGGATPPAGGGATGAAPVGADTWALGTDPPLKSDRIQLVGETGQTIRVGVRTPLGKHMVRQFGEDSNVWDAEQMVLERDSDGTWQVVPGARTTNETLLNGTRITTTQTLHEGDVLSVGRAEKRISRLPLTVRGA
jgi:hypothetical protein